MNAFDDARRVEEVGMRMLLPFFRSHSLDGQIVLIAKGDLAKRLQEEIGDLLMNAKKTQELLSIECKIEEKNKYSNFFLETWSNKKRQKPGWMLNALSATWLAYFFIREQDLYMIRLEELRSWAFCSASKEGNEYRIEDFPEKEQKKRDQLNDTWGRCVPIATLKYETSLHQFHINHNQLAFKW